MALSGGMKAAIINAVSEKIRAAAAKVKFHTAPQRASAFWMTLESSAVTDYADSAKPPSFIPRRLRWRRECALRGRRPGCAVRLAMTARAVFHDGGRLEADARLHEAPSAKGVGAVR
jgi:hypothetical protein